ncbi:hypothetical protein J5N97_022260 [Dioscorea zingiberensis]|uniref:Cytochrome c oxidase assembly factor 5 n=1 Tax=Dioscorea zingiberensis TaxID=325984 RepID=A0A9D5CAU9_9LILI|nr:hypothetical protein J5N97_022260 [Dioscorea zingiberensis]
MSKSCKGLAMELVKCLSETDCVKVENRPFRECAGEKPPSISSECVGLRETYFNCKRGQVDMRARIRGNKGMELWKEMKDFQIAAMDQVSFLQS